MYKFIIGSALLLIAALQKELTIHCCHSTKVKTNFTKYLKPHKAEQFSFVAFHGNWEQNQILRKLVSMILR